PAEDEGAAIVRLLVRIFLVFGVGADRLEPVDFAVRPGEAAVEADVNERPDLAHGYFPFAARFKGSMSSLTIWSICFMTRSRTFGSLSRISSERIVGTTCQESPNLSFSQPH